MKFIYILVVALFSIIVRAQDTISIEPYSALPNIVWFSISEHQIGHMELSDCNDVKNETMKRGGFYKDNWFGIEQNRGLYFDSKNPSKAIFFQKCKLPNREVGVVLRARLEVTFKYDDRGLFQDDNTSSTSQELWFQHADVLNQSNLLKAYYYERGSMRCNPSGNICQQPAYEDWVNFLQTSRN